MGMLGKPKQQTVDSTLSRGYGTLAGLGVIGAAIFAVPSTLLLDPLPGAEAYLVTVAGLFTGLVCMALPWERMDPRWLHVVGVLVTVEAAWAVEVFGQPYTAFFFLIAVAIAYATPDPQSLYPHLVLIGLALFGPILYGSDAAQATLQMALVVYPLLVLTAGIFAYLRQRMVSDHQSYRLFAEETLALANRIAGTPVAAPSKRRSGTDRDLPTWAMLRVSARASAVAACVLSLPLIGSGLAVAGVKLPGFAAETFGSVGIELPNQGADDAAEAFEPSRNRVEGRQDRAGKENDGVLRATPSRGDEPDQTGLAPSGSSLEGSQGPDDPGPAGDPAVATPNEPSNDTSTTGGNSPGGGAVEDVLDETLGDVGEILDETKLPKLPEGSQDRSKEGEGEDPQAAVQSAERSADGLTGP